MGGRRLVVSQEFLPESFGQQARTEVWLFHRELAWYCDVRVERHDGWVVKLLGAWIKPVESMSPSTDDYNLIQPRLERGNESNKVLVFRADVAFPALLKTRSQNSSPDLRRLFLPLTG